MADQTAQTPRIYTVVIRCTDSLIRLPEDRGLRLSPMRSPFGECEFIVRQRTDHIPEISEPIPRELWIQLRGPAPSIAAAINIAVPTSNDYVRQVAFAANAWHGLVDVHLAYDSTEDALEKAFFQNWVVDERGLPRIARDVDPELMGAVLVAIAELPDEERVRVLRTIVQYSDALQHWKPGSEVYALAHLYMGIEAITPLVIRREIERRGLKDRDALEIALHGPPADSFWLRIATKLFRATGGYTPSRLDPWARREIIFRGDRKTYRLAQKASNQFEHGLAQHAAIQPLAEGAIEKTAQYLREIVLDLLPIASDSRQKLKSPPYSSPVNSGGFDRQMAGSIRSDAINIAAPGQLHPYVRWEFDLIEYRRTHAGAHEMKLTQRINPVMASAARLTIDKVHFSGPTPTSRTNIEFDVARGDAPKEEVVTDAGAHLIVDVPLAAVWADIIGRYDLTPFLVPAGLRVCG